MSVCYYEPFYLFEAFTRPAGQQIQAVQEWISTKNTVTATFKLPGFKQEDVQIEEDNGCAVRERKYGKFSRIGPRGTKEEEIKASLEHRLLTVVFPKAAPETIPKKITIA